jgi:hypothetical protein
VVVTPAPAKPQSARPTVLYGGKTPPVKTPAGTVLDDAQKESAIEGLAIRKHLFREEIFPQIQDIVYGNRDGTSIKPTDIEQRICNMLGIPGF